MGNKKPFFNRTRLLLGDEMMTSLDKARVIIFGVGGVGSWCAEGLVRSGIGHLTIVDSDRVCITNINRQMMATSKTIGMVKVEALKERLHEINPDVEVNAIQAIYSEETADQFDLDSFDYVVDAIDSLKDKASLILHATRSKSKFFSSMGAALKIDPRKIEVAEFWKVRGCPLARALRQRFKKQKRYPAKKFLCVYSDELIDNKGKESSCGTDRCVCPKSENGVGDPSLVNHEWCSSKARINGSLMHVTSIFGLTIAGLILEDIHKNYR
ncbi:MAG: tRNA threonylcarbamoyladenosine dehydratase [Muribaculaceae bacterium]|nr:tRNA threonylcarbamoyladenosine dehydratase [Muribaculaceae bacterium]